MIQQKEYSVSYKLKRTGVKLRQTGRKLSDVAWKMQLNPRGTIKEGAALVAENPITITSQVLANPIHTAAASAINPALGVTVATVVPNSLPYAAGEALLKKKFPGYARATKRAGEAIRKSGTVDAVLGIQPEVNFRNAGPNASLTERAKYNLRSGLADISGGIQAAGKSILSGIR